MADDLLHFFFFLLMEILTYPILTVAAAKPMAGISGGDDGNDGLHY